MPLQLGVDLAETRHLAHPLLEERKPAFGAKERLVIKTNRQKPAERVDDLGSIARESAEGVHGVELGASRQRRDVAA